jgi:hypothetical protein
MERKSEDQAAHVAVLEEIRDAYAAMVCQTAWDKVRAIDAAIAALGAQREVVAFRFLQQFGGVYAWTRWLPMDELHHYGPDGNLIDGPDPLWRIEYAYAAPTEASR